MFINPGILFALLAFTSWGLLPLFWKSLDTIPALEILCHRMLWSLLSISLVLGVARRFTRTIHAIRSPRTLVLFSVSGLLIGCNWLIYIWSVNNNFLVESSLGYFITPLVNILLGKIFFKETLRPIQKISVLLATIGVALLTVRYGQFPWIAASLAVTFSLYGLLRKIATAGALEGLFVETMLLALPALLYLLSLEHTGTRSFFLLTLDQQILLALAGPLTVLPLYWYTKGARQIRLATLGIMQYCAPTLQFLLAVFVFKEPFSYEQLQAYLFIWTALALFSIEGLITHRNTIVLNRSVDRISESLPAK